MRSRRKPYTFKATIILKIFVALIFKSKRRDIGRFILWEQDECSRLSIAVSDWVVISGEKYHRKNSGSDSTAVSHFRFFLLRDFPAGEKSADSSCGTHVRRIKSGRKLWRWHSGAGNSSPDIPRDPTSPEIKVPSYWLKGVVKFTDTAVRRDRELSTPRYASFAWTDNRHPSFVPRGKRSGDNVCPL